MGKPTVRFIIFWWIGEVHIRSFRTPDCDSDHCLVVDIFRERQQQINRDHTDFTMRVSISRSWME
jgi:hypothetical protein